MTIAVVLLCLGVPAASAHHSPAAYDMTKDITIKGTVKSYRWANPHVYVDVVTREPDGRTVTWKVEGAWPGLLVARGWSRNTLKIGDHVEVTGKPAKNAAHTAMMGMSLKKGDGIAMVLNVPPGTPTDESALAKLDRKDLAAAAALVGTWEPLKSTAPLFIADNPNLTDKGKALAAGATPAMDPAERARCVPYPPPFNMSWEGVKGFEARGGGIVIRPAVDGDVERIVHMNRAAHDRSVTGIQGDSIGHWEGDTLIVDTVFNVKNGIVLRGVPSYGVTRLVERFALNKDRNRLDYSFSVENPEYLTEPFTGTATWAFRPNVKVPHLACDVDSARSFLED